VKGRARCWRCVALGLLASGLIHAAAAGWWLRGWPPPTSLAETRPETQLVELDFAVFGSAPGEALSEPAAVPETVALAAVPEPEPLPEPEPEPEPPTPPLDEPEALPEEAPEPPEPTPEPDIPVEPEIAPEIAPEPELQPPVPPTPEPRVRVKPPEKRPIQPIRRPKKEVQRQPPKPAKRIEVAEADRGPRTAPSATKPIGPGSAGPTATKAPAGPRGGAAAPRSAGKAEASYLAELQRAIARHQRFPDDARKRRKTGVTTLAFVVQGDGRIRQVRVAKSSGDASLDEAAVQALQRLNRFKPIPAVIGRQEWSMRVPIRFDLR
jgi:protein TonB